MRPGQGEGLGSLEGETKWNVWDGSVTQVPECLPKYVTSPPPSRGKVASYIGWHVVLSNNPSGGTQRWGGTKENAEIGQRHFHTRSHDRHELRRVCLPLNAARNGRELSRQRLIPVRVPSNPECEMGVFTPHMFHHR